MRPEFWYFSLFSTLITVALNIIDQFVFQNDILAIAYGIAVLLPTLGVSVRRLHDVDFSGWFILLNLIPILGPLFLFVLVVMEGTKGSNNYGTDPREYELNGEESH